MNAFGGNPFGGGLPPQYPGSFPQQSFGQFGGVGAPGFYGSGGTPFQGGNVFPGGSPFPPPSGFPPTTVGGQFGQGYNYPPVSGPFGFQPPSYGAPYAPGQQLPYGSAQQPPYGSAQQPPYAPGQPAPFGPSFFPGQQPPNANSNYFGSGSYGRPRSRHSSRRRSKTRRHQSSTSSSSSSDEAPNRGSPFQKHGNPYNNGQPFANIPPMQPGGGAPFIPPRHPGW